MTKTASTLISLAMSALAIIGAPAAHAGPTLRQLCDAQAWPRAVPDVVGKLFEPIGTAISPRPGTPAGRRDPITVHLAPIDGSARSSLRPCDWVTTDEVAEIFGMPAPVETDGFVPPGSVSPHCTYRSPGRTAVATTLLVPGAFPVDAAAEYARDSGENATEIAGLGLAARCLTTLHGAGDRPYNEVVVLLPGDRLLRADGLGAQPCEQLTQFAGTAMTGLER